MKRTLFACGAALALLAVGCGGSTPSPTGGGTGGNGGDDAGALPHSSDLAMPLDLAQGGSTDCPSTASVCGHILYTGAKQGTLGVAAYPTMTPGFPDKFVTVMTPAFPQPYSLSGLSDGDHWLQAILFVGHPAVMPQAGDPQSMITKVTVHAGTPATLDLTLADM